MQRGSTLHDDRTGVSAHPSGCCQISGCRTAQSGSNKALARLLCAEDDGETELMAAMRYATLHGGKRNRALLCLAAGALADTPVHMLDDVGAAIAMMHACTLVHDDLPAMDDDVLRRGLLTVHVKFGEATAILVGDALQAHAFLTLASLDAPGDNRIALPRAGAGGVRRGCRWRAGHGSVAGWKARRARQDRGDAPDDERSARARVRSHGHAMRHRGGCRARCAVLCARSLQRMFWRCRWSTTFSTRQRIPRRGARPLARTRRRRSDRRVDHGAAGSAPVRAGSVARRRGGHRPAGPACGTVGADPAAGQRVSVQARAMRMSAPVRMEAPLCRCDRPAAAVHAALCPSPRGRSQRLPSTAAAHAARCAQAYAADRRQHRGASPRRSRRPSGAAHAPGRDGPAAPGRDGPAATCAASARSWFSSTV